MVGPDSRLGVVRVTPLCRGLGRHSPLRGHSALWVVVQVEGVYRSGPRCTFVISPRTREVVLKWSPSDHSWSSGWGSTWSLSGGANDYFCLSFEFDIWVSTVIVVPRVGWGLPRRPSWVDFVFYRDNRF